MHTNRFSTFVDVMHARAGKTAAMLQSVDTTGGSLQTLLLQIMISLVTLSIVLCSAAFAFRESLQTLLRYADPMIAISNFRYSPWLQFQIIC
jgi:hypothetical protein